MTPKTSSEERPRNVAQLKRLITPETTIRVIAHWQPKLVGTVRKPLALRASGKRGIQINGYYYAGVSHDGKPCEMWAEIPKGSVLRFNENGTVTFYPDTDKSWTLAFELERVA